MILDNPAHQAHKESEVCLDLREFEDLQDSRVYLVFMAKTEYLDHRASAGLQ